MIHTNANSNLLFRIGPKNIYFGPHFIPYHKVSQMVVHEKLYLVRVFFTEAMCLNQKTTIDFVFISAQSINEFILSIQLFANKRTNPDPTPYPFFPHYTFYPEQAFRHQYQFFPSHFFDNPIDLSKLVINRSIWEKEIQFLQNSAKLNPRLRSTYNKLFGYFDLIVKHRIYKGAYLEFFSNIYHQVKSIPLYPEELKQVEQLQRM